MTIHKQGIEQIRQDVIGELTPGSGVTIDGVPLKDGNVDGLDASGVAANATNDALPTVEANDISDDVGDTAQKCREFTMNCARQANSIKLTWEQKADGASDTIYAFIYKNGGQVHSGFTTVGTTYQEKSKVLTAAYKIGDTIEIWVSGDTGSDHVYVRNAHLSYEHATTLATVTQGS